MHTFTIRELREHTGTLIRNAEEGKLSLITKRGQPVFIAVPFSQELVEWGLLTTLAISLYKENKVTLEKAAKLANQSIESFIEKIGKLGIPVLSYDPSELGDELTNFEK
jgi:prevent-host-death family protein